MPSTHDDEGSGLETWGSDRNGMVLSTSCFLLAVV